MNAAQMHWIILLVALAPYIYYLLCIYGARRFFRSAASPPQHAAEYTPPVSILKPVRGLDREAGENFSSFCRLDYPQYELLFCVGEADDPAIPVIEQLMRDFPERSIRLLVGADRLGNNDKVCKLCRLAREARYSLLAVSDSDIRVSPDYLRQVVAPFRDPKVGAVTTLFRGLAGRGLGSRLEAVSGSVEFCSGAIAALCMEGVRFAHGATMATTRQRLAEIGGFEALADLHSDDFAFGNRIAARGHRVALLPRAVWMVYPAQTMRDYLLHELRWMIGLRNIRPWGHFGLVFTHGIFWSVLAAMIAPSSAIAAAYLGAYLGLRTWMAWEVGVRGVQDEVLRQNMWLVPVRDALAVFVWLGSFFSNRIRWRGVRFTIQAGRLVPAMEAAPAENRVSAPRASDAS